MNTNTNNASNNTNNNNTNEDFDLNEEQRRELDRIFNEPSSIELSNTMTEKQYRDMFEKNMITKPAHWLNGPSTNQILDYKSKYLKYKSKYLALKKTMKH